MWRGWLLAVGIASCKKTARQQEPVAPPLERICHRYTAAANRVDLTARCVAAGKQFSSPNEFAQCLSALEHMRLIDPMVAKRAHVPPRSIEVELERSVEGCRDIPDLGCLAGAKQARGTIQAGEPKLHVVAPPKGND